MRVEVGKDRIRYFLYLNGRWRWRPTKIMREKGFALVTMGAGGPNLDQDGNPAASATDKATAIALNQDWDHVRRGLPRPVRPVVESWPEGSVGDGYQRAMAMRLAERRKNGKVWTKEQESRDDWPRAWKWLGPEFGDCDPKTIEPEHFLRIDPATEKVTGLIALIEAEVSVTERHRVIKVWRALWKRMHTMGYCGTKEDPSKSIANTAPDARQAQWQRREVLRMVQRAWREGYYGLAACMAVAWDTMLSPIDARSLTPAQCSFDALGALFLIDRAKTGKSAAGTLSAWSQAILVAYLTKLGVELHDNAQIFRTRGYLPEPGKGKAWAPRPYTKNSLVSDFAAVREMVFGKGDKRQLSDMRRSGAVEGDAGAGSVTDQSNKMANTVSTNNRLRKTYNPVNLASVRRFDEARARGAKLLEQKKAESVTVPALVTLLKNLKPVSH